ncbi:DsbA family protein [Latilactobacillus sakei]|uniref:DsbA family protein n=1 Tax=Latilactobacillus sakei TaxID=1599 RepID=UPI0009763E45|nr:DsbA family protein [Latilactobacillus sakei]
MDISVIKSDQVTTEGGIVIGHPEAPVTLVEFLNLACPYCRKWFLKSEEQLTKAVEAGQVRRIIKPYNKDKDDLLIGNLAHTYLPFDQPAVALNAIHFLYTHQKTWRPDLSDSEFDKYMQANLKLSPLDNTVQLAAIVDEAQAANIKFVPTIIAGEHIFDESITPEELDRILQAK